MKPPESDIAAVAFVLGRYDVDDPRGVATEVIQHLNAARTWACDYCGRFLAACVDSPCEAARARQGLSDTGGWDSLVGLDCRWCGKTLAAGQWITSDGYHHACVEQARPI